MAKTVSNPKSQNICVIHGDNYQLVSEQYEKLLDSLLSADQRQTGLFVADTRKDDAANIFDELNTMPFLTDKRVVVVKDADDFVSDNRESLERYFDNPSKTSCLILLVKKWQSNTKLAKKLPQAGQLIEVAEPKGAAVVSYLTDYAQKNYNKKLLVDACQLLIELAGEDLGRLHSEIDKLALYNPDKNTITEDDVENLVGKNRIYGTFEVIDAVTDGKLDLAVQRLRNMFANDKDAEYTTVGAFAYHFRRLFLAKKLINEGQNQYQVGQAVKLWYRKDEFFRQLGKMTIRQIGQIISKLAKIDFEIKTGQTTAQVAIEQLVFEICGLTSPKKK